MGLDSDVQLSEILFRIKILFFSIFSVNSENTVLHRASHKGIHYATLQEFYLHFIRTKITAGGI